METEKTPDGTVIARKKFVPQDYEDIDVQNRFNNVVGTPEEYNQMKELYEQDATMEWQEITFMSNGLKVKGFIIKPKEIWAIEPARPAIINIRRGGGGQFGKITVKEYQKFRTLLDNNFVIACPQFPGVDGGEGVDKLGGKDINDIFSIKKVLEDLSYVDKNNIFGFAEGTGATRLTMAMGQGLQIKAAALINGFYNFLFYTNEFSEEERKKPTPSLEKPDDRSKMDPRELRRSIDRYHRKVMCGSEKPEKEVLVKKFEKRSAVCWPEKLAATPLLIVHGMNCSGVTPHSQAIQLAERLNEVGHTQAKLELYPGMDFSMNNVPDQRAKVMKACFRWFKDHKKSKLN